MKIIKFIYFDVGNIFFTFSHSCSIIAQNIGINPQTLEDAWVAYSEAMNRGTLSVDDFWQNFCKDNTLRNANFSFNDKHVEQFIPIHEMHRFVEFLHKSYPIGLLTNCEKGKFPLVFQMDKVPDLRYAQIVMSCDIGLLKPERTMFEYAQSLVSCTPNEVLFVDDMEINVKGAQEFGWNAIQFDPNNVHKSIQVIKEYIGYA